MEGNLPILKTFTVFDTNNASDVANSLNKDFHDVDIDIKNPKQYRATYSRLPLGHVSLHGAYLSSGHQIKSEGIGGSLVLLFLTTGEMRIKVGGDTFTATPGALAPVMDFEQTTFLSPQSEHANIVLRFTPQCLVASLTAITGRRVDGLIRFPSHIDLTQPGPGRLLNVCRHIGLVFDQDLELANNSIIVSRYEDLIKAVLLTCIEHSHGALLHAPPVRYVPKAVLRAEEYIDANINLPIRLGDIVAVTGLGGRSLQMAFKKHRGYTISQFICERRLHSARRLLMAPEPGTKIISVAHSCGFSSHSLFSRLYRERFGELPSDTMRRS